jgi:hypothetical protein
MIATIKLSRPENLIFYPATENNLREKKRKTFQHPEDRLWKLSTQTAAPDFTFIESLAMLVLTVMALVAIGQCFIALSQLLQADAIQHIVVQAVKPAAPLALREPFNFPFPF